MSSFQYIITINGIPMFVCPLGMPESEAIAYAQKLNAERVGNFETYDIKPCLPLPELKPSNPTRSQQS